jgi:predicted dehydrogenase
LQNFKGVFADRIEVAGIYDLDVEKAKSRAKEFGVETIYDSLEGMLKDSTVDIILNLTRPYEHYNVSKAVMMAGKHVYSEKPLGASLEEGVQLHELAKKKGVLIGGAPDTFLGAGIQTCIKLIDDGVIGDVVGSSAFMVCRGHESWHPSPEFYYKFGGGPMLDMGPYYITALVSMMGPIKSLTGVAKASFPTRTITSEALYGTVIDVDVATYVAGVMEFASGAVGTIFTTFDVYTAQVPRIEIYGSKGTLSVPDPNTFGGPVLLYEPENEEFREVPLIDGYSENSRGLGLYDMARHLEEGTPFRASGDLLYHVLEAITGFDRAYENKGFEEMKSVTKRPEPMR